MALRASWTYGLLDSKLRARSIIKMDFVLSTRMKPMLSRSKNFGEIEKVEMVVVVQRDTFHRLK